MFATQQRQAENTKTTEISNQEVNIDEKSRMEREMKSSDVTELERINRTKQQSSEDKDINTSVRQQVTTTHERTEVDESMKILENYSGEVVNNIMKCGPNINLNSARNMVNTVLIDESITRAADGSQGIVVIGDRNIVRNTRLHNMINLVGDTNVYDCVVKQVSDLISKKDSLLSSSNSKTGSTLKGADLETEGSKVTDENKSDMGSENKNEIDLKKDSGVTSEFGLESTTTAGQKTTQETILDFMQGAGAGGIGIIAIIILAILGIIFYVVYKIFSTASDAMEAATDVATSTASAVTGAPPPEKKKWGFLHYAALFGLLALIGFGIWQGVEMMKATPPKKEPFGITFQERSNTAPTRAEQYVAGALALVLVILVVYRVSCGGQPKMVGGGLGLPSFYELYLFILTLAIVGVSVAFFVINP